MKRILRGILIGGLLVLILAVPVLAAYYAYITVAESDGNSYEELPVVVSRNITQLVQYGLMSSTGLDSRVLTGDGAVLPHMLADDKVLFTSDLAAYETKTLIFYLGATSLSSFPIIVGYNGSFETPDDPDLELGYIMELLVSGYFNAETADIGHNILYKEDALRVWISAANTIKVATYNSTGDEQWEMHYSSFTTGPHTVYIVCNGLGAYLYVDDFDIAKDTQNLFESSNVNLSNTFFSYLYPQYRFTFYANGHYWAFYTKSASYTAIYYKTSADGTSWSSENTISIVAGDTIGGYGGIGVWLRGDYMHITYGGRQTGQDYVRYRRGVPELDGTITWSADWQGIACINSGIIVGGSSVVVDVDDYPVIVYEGQYGVSDYSYITKSSTNDGTWSTQGGYPLLIGQTSPISHSETITAYPNSNKMYASWSQDEGTSDYNWYLFGRYYNGDSWSGSSETIDYGRYASPSYQIGVFCAVADNDDNVYIVWDRTVGGSYLKVRWADGTFSSAIQISSTSSSPSVSYNDNTNYIYITYMRAGAARCVALNLNEWVISSEYTLFTPTGLSALSATPYGNHIGILYLTSVGGYTEHGYIQFPWEWNDNDNDWYWMQNNVIPYADDIQMAVDGELQLEYKPDAIILGTTLPDEENDHDGIITWGSNPAGVTATIGTFKSDVEVGGNQTAGPGMGNPQDMIGPTGNPGYTKDVGTLTGNPLYPLVKAFSDNTGIPVQLWWIILASLVVLIAMVVTYWKLPHQIITAFVGGGLSAFFYAMGIYPFWVVLIFAVMALAIIIGERSPTV